MTTDQMLAALIVAREIISTDRNFWADTDPDDAGIADYDAALVQISAAIDAPASGWQPIETAPDETPVWLCDASGAVWIGEYAYDGNGWYWANTYMAVYYRQDGTWASSSADWDDDYQPTHWQPLPTAPNQEVKP